jgi:hypothetical protein
MSSEGPASVVDVIDGALDTGVSEEDVEETSAVSVLRMAVVGGDGDVDASDEADERGEGDDGDFGSVCLRIG